MAGLDLKLKKRMFWTVVFLAVCVLVMIVRIMWIQFVDGPHYREKALAQQTRDSLINAERGSITDRNGKILAQSATAETVVVNPSAIEEENLDEVVSTLAEILDMDYDTVYKKATKKSGYEKIKTRIESEVADEIRAAKLQGVTLEEDTKRYYPYEKFASHIIGFTGTDGYGLAGIEAMFDGVLEGKQGKIESMKNAKGMDMPYTNEKYIAPEDGQNVVLTIDETIQHFAEKYLEQAYVDNKLGNGGACIIMDPNTGEILAMAVAPDFDLNEPMVLTEEFQIDTEGMSDEDASKLRSDALQKMWRNKAVSDSYEPGSVFKVMVSGMAFEENVVEMTDSFTCTGVRHVGDRDIHCWKLEGHGPETFVQAVENSCNPAFMEIGDRIGTSSFIKYFQSFGLNSKTGIELPGEASGVFFSADNFTEINLATSSFGQSFEVTPIQMITAFSAMVNGGNLMQPHIVKAYTDSDGNVVQSFEPEVLRQVVSAQTSENMRTALESVVSSGTAKNAYLKGYRVGGKTGTSEKLPRGSGLRIASFIGFAPADNPQVVCMVILDEPGGDATGGGAIAAPVVGDILLDVLKYMGVEQQFSQEELLKMDISTPEVREMSVVAAEKTLTDLGFKVTVKGNGTTVTDQVPAPGAKMSGESTIILYTEGMEAPEEVKVPDLTGLTVLQSNQKLTESGLNLKFSDVASVDREGKVVAVTQDPPAGTKVPKGTVIYVEYRDFSNPDQ